MIKMIQCHEKDGTGNPDGWNGRTCLARASVRVTFRASESLCFCSTTRYEACVNLVHLFFGVFFNFLEKCKLTREMTSQTGGSSS